MTSARDLLDPDQARKQPIYLVVGVPGSGKSWVCEQLKDDFEYVHHDGFIGHISQPEAYVKEILDKAPHATKPLLTEAPFSIRSIKDPLEDAGYDVHAVYIIDDPKAIARQYKDREKKPIPKGHLTRMQTYAQRAKESGAFQGNSTKVLAYLKDELARLRKT